MHRQRSQRKNLDRAYAVAEGREEIARKMKTKGYPVWVTKNTLLSDMIFALPVVLSNIDSVLLFSSALSLLDFGIVPPGSVRFFKCRTSGTSQFCRGTRHYKLFVYFCEGTASEKLDWLPMIP